MEIHLGKGSSMEVIGGSKIWRKGGKLDFTACSSPLCLWSLDTVRAGWDSFNIFVGYWALVWVIIDIR